jgi:leader peptidase (prepilin peptidase) / N-methyltransferase
MTLLVSAAVGILGLIWGSFFNVCILRIPVEETVLFDRSRCPKCKALIPWYLNIPLLSYLFLRGKCVTCKAPISIQYPLVELFTALMYIALYLHFGLTLSCLAYAVFVSLLIIISVIDLHHRIIPDVLSLPGAAVGLVLAPLLAERSFFSSCLGLLIGGGAFLAVAWLYEKVTKREGLGGGDIKLLGMIGAWLGIGSILPVIVISSAMGSVVGIAIMYLGKKDLKAEIPFGPFLAVAALIHLFFEQRILTLLFPQLP